MQTLGNVEFHPNFRRFVFCSIVVHPVFFDLGQSGMGGGGGGGGVVSAPLKCHLPA